MISVKSSKEYFDNLDTAINLIVRQANNLKGQLVESLINKQLKLGFHSFVWDATDFASGVYIYQLQSIDNSITKKMVLMK
mgnify:CR=1 FL=1